MWGSPLVEDSVEALPCVALPQDKCRDGNSYHCQASGKGLSVNLWEVMPSDLLLSGFSPVATSSSLLQVGGGANDVCIISVHFLMGWGDWSMI